MPEKHARRGKKLLCEVERIRKLCIRMKMERKKCLSSGIVHVLVIQYILVLGTKRNLV